MLVGAPAYRPGGAPEVLTPQPKGRMGPAPSFTGKRRGGMMPDVDVRALTDTALWEGITRCARSQDMWARQMAAANNGERGPAYRHALAQWKQARGRIWRRWTSMIAGPSCTATGTCPPANWMRDSWSGTGGPPGWPDTCAPWRRTGRHGGVCTRNGSGRACMVRRSGASAHNPPSHRKPPHMLPGRQKHMGWLVGNCPLRMVCGSGFV